jgi:prepilin-type processing-associated H-X9-DG protein
VFGELSAVAQIPKGESNVLLAGEKYLNPDDYFTGAGPGDNNSALQGNGAGITRWSSSSGANGGFQRDMKGNTQQYDFGSAHVAGFNVVFCDGHAELLSWSLDGATFVSLTVRN